jgi:hypothetical protein
MARNQKLGVRYIHIIEGVHQQNVDVCPIINQDMSKLDVVDGRDTIR